ncbi:MAG: SDR family oxidoreductase [Solirubrobacteraceae bacterium]|nr:SDR family oxidoreductase [Solirubrobacteraceae bacterium]
MDLGITDRAALVCGATQGIGRAIAAELVAEGARVAITSRSQERADATAAELGGVLGFAHDTADADGAEALLERAGEALGAPITLLVTNTGGPPGNPDALGFARDQWEDAYRELVLGPMALVQAAIPAMRAEGFGRIVNIVSTGPREPIPNLMLSNTHRAATLAAFKTVARQVAGDGITLNSVLPGRIATPRLFSLYGGSKDEANRVAAAEVPAGRIGEPEEMAAAAAFFLSARAGYVTGQALIVDGGLTRAV